MTQHEPSQATQVTCEVFLAATAWYWYTYFAPRLWPAENLPADPVAIPAFASTDMPASPDTVVTPKAATPVTLPALWEPEAHNEAILAMLPEA